VAVPSKQARISKGLVLCGCGGGAVVGAVLNKQARISKDLVLGAGARCGCKGAGLSQSKV